MLAHNNGQGLPKDDYDDDDDEGDEGVAFEVSNVNAGPLIEHRFQELERPMSDCTMHY